MVTDKKTPWHDEIEKLTQENAGVVLVNKLDEMVEEHVLRSVSSFLKIMALKKAGILPVDDGPTMPQHIKELFGLGEHRSPDVSLSVNKSDIPPEIARQLEAMAGEGKVVVIEGDKANELLQSLLAATGREPKRDPRTLN